MLSSGITLDNILDLSWDQIQICSRSIMRHKINMINMILEPVAASLGSDYKKGKVSKNSKNKQKPKMTKEQKDAILIQKFQQMGWMQ